MSCISGLGIGKIMHKIYKKLFFILLTGIGVLVSVIIIRSMRIRRQKIGVK